MKRFGNCRNCEFVRTIEVKANVEGKPGETVIIVNGFCHLGPPSVIRDGGASGFPTVAVDMTYHEGAAEAYGCYQFEPKRKGKT